VRGFGEILRLGKKTNESLTYSSLLSRLARRAVFRLSRVVVEPFSTKNVILYAMQCHVGERETDKKGIHEATDLHKSPPSLYTSKTESQTKQYTHIPLSPPIIITTPTPTTSHPIPPLTSIPNILTTPHSPNRPPQIPQSPTKTSPSPTRPPTRLLLIRLRSPPTNRLTQVIARPDAKIAFSTPRHSVCANAAATLEVLHHGAERCAEWGSEKWSASADALGGSQAAELRARGIWRGGDLVV
jgi:hypothetical protein